MPSKNIKNSSHLYNKSNLKRVFIMLYKELNKKMKKLFFEKGIGRF